MSLTTHRREGYRCELLTRTDASLGNLGYVEGGHLEWNANADLPGGGTIVLETDDSGHWEDDQYGAWVEQRRNLAQNPKQVTGGSSSERSARFGYVATYVTQTWCPETATATRMTHPNNSTSYSPGVDFGNNPDIAPGTSGAWLNYPVVPGTTIKASAWAAFSNAQQWRLGARFHDGAGNWVGTFTQPNTFPDSTQGTTGFLVPAGAAYAVFRLSGTVAQATPTSFFEYTAISISVTDGYYFDGDTVGLAPKEQYRWLGAANASASVYETRQAISRKWVSDAQVINVSSDRIRVWWEVEGEDPWSLGVYVMAAPATQYRADVSSRVITLIDKLTVIRDDCLLQTLQIPAGANIVQAVVAQIQATGETRIAATASSTVLSNPLAWEPGTSRLRVINDLLTAAGYWSLWTDRNGQFRVEPYIAPAARPITWEFKEGAAAIHSPDWEYELALWDATNTVIMVSQADKDTGLTWTATAVDDNPDSPTSTVTMGRVLNPIVEENVEAISQAALQAQASRKLIDNSNVVGRLSVAHAPVPVWYNEAVIFVSQGVNTRATITKMSLELAPGALVTAEWRQA